MSTHPPLRLAFITHYTELYGANLSMLNLIEGLAALGVESGVICPDRGDLLAVLTNRNIPVAQLPFEWWVSTHRTARGAAGRMIRNVRNLPSITRQIRQWKANMVYSNSSVFSVGALAAMELELPHIWHLREFGDRDYGLRPDAGTQLSRLAFGSAAATICVSHALQRAKLGATPRANAHVIYNGVATQSTFDKRRILAHAQHDRQQPFTFALVGRFRESKGQAIAIRALASGAAPLRNARLLLVGGSGETGDQTYFDRCRSLATELGVGDRVEFWGYIPDPERAFLAADAVLMCSSNEAMGRVTAEAMSACRPVIGFDGGGTTELIDHGRTGLLYRGGAEALAASMTQYASTPAIAKQHGAAGWLVARERHATETYAAQIHAVLRMVQSASIAFSNAQSRPTPTTHAEHVDS